MTLSEAVLYAETFLKDKNVSEYSLNAQYIAAYCLNLKRKEIFFNQEKVLSSNNLKKLKKLLALKAKGWPLSWLLKSAQFCDLELIVDKGVFTPRPETEELAVMALKESFSFKTPKILDFCSGSGCLGVYLSAKNPDCEVFAADASQKAVRCALKNKKKFQLKNLTVLLKDNLRFKRKFDLIVSNPPYIPKRVIENLDPEVKIEPLKALLGGRDGLDMIRYIEKNSALILKKNGIIFLEFGFDQAEAVFDIFSAWKKKEIIKDIYAKNRFLKAVKNG